MKQHTHMIAGSFNCLEDDQVGEIQHLVIDQKKSARSVAQQYGVSVATVYRAKNAVPMELAKVNPLAVKQWRTPRRKTKRQKVA